MIPAAVVYETERAQTVLVGRALGLTDEQIVEVIDVWWTDSVARPTPLSWPQVRQAVTYRGIGRDWRPRSDTPRWPEGDPRGDLQRALREFGVALAARSAPWLGRLAAGLDRALRRWPWLYRRLS